MKCRFMEKKYTLVSGILVYRILLDFIYSRYICATTSRWKYLISTSSFNIENYAVSFFILIISIPFYLIIINEEKKRASSLICVCLYVANFIPFTTNVGFGLYADEKFIFYNTIFWLILLIFCSSFFGFDNILDFKKWHNNKYIHQIRQINIIPILIGNLILFCVLYVSGRYTGFRLWWDLSTVYDLRREALEWNIPTIIIYFYSISKKICGIFMGYCILTHKKILASIFFLMQLLIFGIDGDKSVLFSMIFILVFLLARRFFSCNRIENYVILGLIMLCIGCIIEVYFLKSDKIGGGFIRRMLFEPPWLSWCYWDFFQNHEFDYFRESFLRHFGFISPYNPEGIARYIGKMYFNDWNIVCNNGLVADSLVNFGYFGVLIWPIMLKVVFLFFDFCTMDIDYNVLVITAIPYTFAFISSSLSTIFITHGFFLICIFFYFLRR